MKKINWIWSLLLCGVLFWGAGLTAQAKENAVIHDGVYLGEVNVSGLSLEEAGLALEEYTQILGTNVLTLQIDENQVQVPLGDLGLSCANQEVVEEALGLGKSGDIIKRFKETKQLERSNRVFDLMWTVDPELVSQVVESECVKFDVAAKDAGLTRSNGSFNVIPGVTGVKLNVNGSKQAVIDFIENQWALESNPTVALLAEVDVPKGTDEELAKVKDLLGTFTTSYSTSGASRSKNVSNGTRLINGIVMYPGDVFSAYEVVNPFTEENGYAMAGSYLNGKVVDSLGGGICQVTTTLYNAVLLAELEIVERANHSMIVTYVDPAADAAIAGTYKDFKFSNNTNAPIYIEGITTSDKKVTFNIYGEETRPANRTVKYKSVTLSTTDPGQVIVADPGQGIGYYHRESAHWGYVAELYKHVYEDGVEVSKERVNKSTYKASPRTITVGVAGDPALSAELQAAIATQDEATVQATLAYCVAQMQQ